MRTLLIIGIVLQILGLILGLAIGGDDDEDEEEDNGGRGAGIVIVIIGTIIGIVITVLSCRFAILSGRGLERSIRANGQNPIAGQNSPGMP